jgi:toxin ParE1/3/4
MKRFFLGIQASEDIEEIWGYIADDDPHEADRFVEKIHGAILRVADTPRIGHSRADVGRKNSLLFWPVGDYLIVYRPTDPVEVVAVTHGNRDIPALIRRRGL